MFFSTNLGCSGQSEWEILPVTPFSQLGSKERVSVKKIQREERERQVEKRAQRAEERVQRAEERARRAEERVQQDGGMGEREQLLEARVDELQRRLDEERREHERLTAQLEERENVLQHTEERVQQAEERVQQAEERVQQERERVQRAEGRAQEAEVRVQRAEETVQEEMERVQRAEERAQQAEEREQRDREALGQRVQLAEARAAELQRRLDEVEGRERERLTVLQHTEERVQRAEGRAQEAEEKVRRAEEMVQEEMERVQRAEERAQQAEERQQRDREAVAELQRRLDEVEGREQERLAVQQQAIAAEQRGPSWEVGEEDIQLTGEVIGTGGWGAVRVAHLKVAAKELHSQLESDYYDQVFQREMAVAAQVSHPNLLRFHGVKLEGGMTILTELMPTSLRAEVNRGRHHPEHRFSREHILSIAMDVACALNYLHHLIPDPIIHRDLSSANVLLKPTPNGGWLAKVSDYGSANFQQQLQIQNPGSPVYAAPESHNPALQSPKMDIFSFGVLLIEMCTSQFPVPERRPDLIESICYSQLVRLIRWCLNEDRNQRPTAAQVINYLPTLQ